MKRAWMLLPLAVACAHAQKPIEAQQPNAAPPPAREQKQPAGPSQPGERARRLLDDAMVAQKAAGKVDAKEIANKFQAAAEEAGAPGPAVFDYAVALDRAGRTQDAESNYRKVGEAKGELGYRAAERIAALALSRGDAQAARSALAVADAAVPGDLRTFVLRSEVELALGDLAAGQAAARLALARQPGNIRALCALARAQLAQGSPGVARFLTSRAAQADADDALPLIVKAEISRSENDPAGELAATRAAAEADADSPQAALVLGRALFERGLTGEAVDELSRAAELDAGSFPAALALGQALAASGQTQEAEQRLARAVALAPKAPQPHFELARLKLDGDGDAQAALSEAKLFLSLSTPEPPPTHPVYALVQRCEEALKQRAQASVVQQK